MGRWYCCFNFDRTQMTRADGFLFSGSKRTEEKSLDKGLDSVGTGNSFDKLNGEIAVQQIALSANHSSE